MFKRFFLSTALFLTIIYTFSQKYNFVNYSIENGLIQSQVNCIIQDSRGYMWFGTYGGGISKFDGKNFISYSEEDGLSKSRIRSLFEDHNGNIWIGTRGGYLCKFDGKNFTKFNSKNGITNSTIYAITQDKSNSIYIGTENDGLYILSNNNFKKIELLNYKNLTIKYLYYSKKSVLWIGSDQGLFSIKNGTVKNYSKIDGLIDNKINYITEDNNNLIWIATEKGISIFDGSVFKTFENNSIITGKNLTSIAIDKFNNFWFSSSDNGIYKWDGVKLENINTNNGLCENQVYRVFSDNTSSIWIGTDGGGVCKMIGEMFMQYTQNQGLSGNIIMSFVEDENKNLWFGTYDAGICMFDGLKYKNYTTNNGLCSDNIYTIFKDSKNNLWFGSRNNGLSKYKNAKFTNYNNNNGLSNNFAQSIVEDKFGYIWIATRGGGLNIFDGKVFHIFNQNDGLGANSIYKIFIDSKNNIWICYENGGADFINNKYDTKLYLSDKLALKNNLKHYSDSNGLPSNQIYSITEDKLHNIWFGTFGGGVAKFDGKKFEVYNKKDGLNSNHTYLIYCDSRNIIWVGTEKGLNKIESTHSDKPFIKSFGKDEGFIGIETNLNAVYEDSKGFVWFGTVRGATKYNPQKDIENSIEPKIYIKNIKLFFEDKDWSKFSDSLSEWFFLPKNLVLKHNNNNLTFEFIGIDQKNPEKIKYQWILEGFDDKWSPITNKTEVTYSNIPPGNYIFKVKACNSDNFWSKECSEFKFTILPPFWMKWWFHLSLVIIFVSLIYAFIKYRIKRIEKEKQYLEEQVNIRTAQLKEQKEKVEKQNSEIYFQKEEIYNQKEEILQQNEEIRQQTEHLMAVNQELEKLSLVAKKTDNSVIITDNKCNIDWINEGFHRMHGYTLEEFIKIRGNNLYDIYSSQNVKKLIDFCLKNKEMVVFDFKSTTKNKNEICLNVTITPIIDNHLEISKLIVLESNITEIKKAEEKLEELNKNLEEKIQEELIKNREKEMMLTMQSRQAVMGEMIGNIAHQWKQPLNAVGVIIQNFVEAHEYGELTDEYMKNHSKKAMDLVHYMSQTITDFRNFFRPDKDKTDFDAKKIVEKAVSFLEATFKIHNINIKMDLSENIIIYGFPNEYSQVIINILNNAKDVIIERMVKEGKIDIKLTSDFNKSILTITDNAGGIPDFLINKIFEPYFTTKDDEHGTGLGLYMSKTIIEQNMKGKLTAFNTENGACFKIEI